jgi:predicted TIM-barrel fold metal-dependent hydrolase
MAMHSFLPNDRLAYPLYEAIQETGKPALFHTGQTGVGSGMRAGNSMRLKYSNPMYIDNVAVDFPDMTIIMAHPSFPWQEEARRRQPQAERLHRPVGLVAEVFSEDSRPRRSRAPCFEGKLAKRP